MSTATSTYGGGVTDAPTGHPRHFLRVADLSATALGELLELAEELKAEPAHSRDALNGETIACIFEKPSTRTRVSFAAAAARLGATPIALTPQELQLGRGETIADTARSLSGYVAAIVIRTFAQETVEELAEWASVPVVNALSDEHHPCQALADLLTIQEAFGELTGRRLVFVGDGGDNVAHSLLEAGALAGLDVTIASPPEYAPDEQVLAEARKLAERTGAELSVLHDPHAAVAGADAVYADVWASMGEESERAMRKRALAPYQVTEELMAVAKPGAIFLHCLPAKRGEEVAATVIDGPQSAVWRQSANRLPTEEALLLALTRGFERDQAERIEVPAWSALSPWAGEHELIVTHGNGPQVGLLALEADAYKAVSPYPLDILGAESQGMIGYLLAQALEGELKNRVVAVLLTQVIVDAADPAFEHPTKPIGPVYDEGEARRLADEHGWTIAPDGQYSAVSFPRPSRARSSSSPRSSSSSRPEQSSSAPGAEASPSSPPVNGFAAWRPSSTRT